MKFKEENSIDYKVGFAGMDEKVFDLLCSSTDFNIVCTNLIKDFLNYKSINPIDSLFKTIYFLRVNDRYFLLEKILSEIFSRLSHFSSYFYQKYAKYLLLLSKNRIKIIDLENIDRSVEYFKSVGLDVLVCSNWWLMPDSIIDAPKYKTINIHPSRLPQYRGSVPTLWSLKNHDKSTAVSVMVLNSMMDGGEILAQHVISISKNEDSLSLEKKSDLTIKKFLLEDLHNYLQGKLKPIPQDHSHASKTAKYLDYMIINWSTESGRDITDKIMLYPFLWPIDQCFFVFENRKISVRNANFVPSKNIDLIGSYKIKNFTLSYYCADGLVNMKLFSDLNLVDSLYILFKK